MTPPCSAASPRTGGCSASRSRSATCSPAGRTRRGPPPPPTRRPPTTLAEEDGGPRRAGAALPPPGCVSSLTPRSWARRRSSARRTSRRAGRPAGFPAWTSTEETTVPPGGVRRGHDRVRTGSGTGSVASAATTLVSNRSPAKLPADFQGKKLDGPSGQKTGRGDVSFPRDYPLTKVMSNASTSLIDDDDESEELIVEEQAPAQDEGPQQQQ